MSLKTHLIPLEGVLATVRQEIESAQNDPSFIGFVLSLGTHEVQKCLAESGLPTVVHGSVYPGIRLPFMEVDQDSVGRIMVRWAIDAGHRQIVFVNREKCGAAATRWRSTAWWTNCMGRGRNTARSRSATAAQSRGRGGVHAPVVGRNGNARGAVVPRSLFCPGGVTGGLRARSAVPEDVMVIYDGTFEVGEQLVDCPLVRCRISVTEEYAMIGRVFTHWRPASLPIPKTFCFLWFPILTLVTEVYIFNGSGKP